MKGNLVNDWVKNNGNNKRLVNLMQKDILLSRLIAAEETLKELAFCARKCRHSYENGENRKTMLERINKAIKEAEYLVESINILLNNRAKILLAEEANSKIKLKEII